MPRGQTLQVGSSQEAFADIPLYCLVLNTILTSGNLAAGCLAMLCSRTP